MCGLYEVGLIEKLAEAQVSARWQREEGPGRDYDFKTFSGNQPNRELADWSSGISLREKPDPCLAELSARWDEMHMMASSMHTNPSAASLIRQQPCPIPAFYNQPGVLRSVAETQFCLLIKLSLQCELFAALFPVRTSAPYSQAFRVLQLLMINTWLFASMDHSLLIFVNALQTWPYGYRSCSQA